jgi:hypothetical protein
MSCLKFFVNRTPTQTGFARGASLRAGPLRAWLVGLCLWLTLGGLTVPAENTVLTEYQVKALYLYNFPEFIVWPTNAFASADSPFVIGIVGDAPFDDKLDGLVATNDAVQGRPLVVRRLSLSDDLQNCQVLFISRSVKDQMPALLEKLKGTPVLTVADTDGFADSGGMVNFVLVKEKVKFEINQAVAQRSGLQIRATMLQRAIAVKNTPP